MEKIVNEQTGAVEINFPDESLAMNVKIEAIKALASACEALAEALNSPVNVVNITGNITTNGPAYALKIKTKSKK